MDIQLIITILLTILTVSIVAFSFYRYFKQPKEKRILGTYETGKNRTTSAIFISLGLSKLYMWFNSGAAINILLFIALAEIVLGVYFYAKPDKETNP